MQSHKPWQNNLILKQSIFLCITDILRQKYNYFCQQWYLAPPSLDHVMILQRFNGSTGEVSKTIFVTTIFACFSNSSKIFEVNLNHNLHLFTSCCCFHTSNFIDNYSDQTLEKHRRTCFSLFSYHLYHNSTALPYVFISGYYLASSQSTKY